MKKLIFALCLAVSPAYAATDVREIGAGCTSGNVAVSTTSPTAIPTTALSGRYRILIYNNDAAFDLAIGTHSAIAFASSFLVKNSTSPASVVDIRLPSGMALYGLGTSNATRGTIDVRYLECK